MSSQPVTPPLGMPEEPVVEPGAPSWNAPIPERMLAQLLDICPVVSRSLPIELWDEVLGYVSYDWRCDLRTRGSREARLQKLGRVCRGWYARCRFLVWEELTMASYVNNKTQMDRLIKTLDEQPERCRVIKAVYIRSEFLSGGLLGPFVACMAQKLPRIQSLEFRRCKLAAEQLGVQVFRDVTLTFGSATVLKLFRVDFSSAMEFEMLVRALPRLVSLTCDEVDFKDRRNVVATVGALHPLRLETVDLCGCDDVIDFLMSTGARIRQLFCISANLPRTFSKLFVAIAESLLFLDMYGMYSRFDDGPPLLSPLVNLRTLSFLPKDMRHVVHVLSLVTLPKLIEVTVRIRVLDILQLPRKLDRDCCTSIDNALSGSQYPALKRVIFHVVLTERGDPQTMYEDSCAREMSCKFPTLHGSGRLRRVLYRISTP
ncbi:uncharacterized protein FIBRA_02922 [Fibroporia radiculosa]|uniref:F-box domain-containing protein n=1 Tax=Fibroporia radiculosa TaxID=599839 RepID=J4I9B6_9APHY|nr:uncharacterized protein FIBRA_02922 [Fibroporia radiculosa]CCM00876.1 predicted protein [Fibroporia radiculosa]